MSNVSKKDIGRVFKLILKTLETSVDLITTGDFMVGVMCVGVGVGVCRTYKVGGQVCVCRRAYNYV